MHRVAVIPGDGIGKEVMPEGIRVLDAAGERFRIKFEWQILPWGCEYYKLNGAMMLEHLGYAEAARAVEDAIESTIAEKDIRTPDLEGGATTEEMGKAIASCLSST